MKFVFTCFVLDLSCFAFSYLLLSLLLLICFGCLLGNGGFVVLVLFAYVSGLLFKLYCALGVIVGICLLFVCFVLRVCLNGCELALLACLGCLLHLCTCCIYFACLLFFRFSSSYLLLQFVLLTITFARCWFAFNLVLYCFVCLTFRRCVFFGVVWWWLLFGCWAMIHFVNVLCF